MSIFFKSYLKLNLRYYPAVLLIGIRKNHYKTRFTEEYEVIKYSKHIPFVKSPRLYFMCGQAFRKRIMT